MFSKSVFLIRWLFSVIRDLEYVIKRMQGLQPLGEYIEAESLNHRSCFVLRAFIITKIKESVFKERLFLLKNVFVCLMNTLRVTR